MRKDDWLSLFLLFLTFVPGKILKLLSRELWVVAEYEMMARDNGYWFFHYLRTEHPELKVYYPISPESPDYSKIKELGNAVKYGRLRHYCLFWAASVYCSSSSVQGFPNQRICEDIVLNRLHGFRYVFLNHGFTRGHSYIVNGKTTNYDLICTCSAADQRIIVQENEQTEETVKVTGFARHDNLNSDETDDKLILIMPTWREWLSYRNERKKSGVKAKRAEFLSSDYFLKYNELLNDPEFLSFLDEHDQHVVFYLHQYAQVYSEYFKSDSDRVTVGKTKQYDVQSLLMKAAVLITDYSSVCYDFAYMKKPVLYYQFDKEQFEACQYAPGKLFSYEQNGFGPLCYDRETLLRELKKSCVSGYEMGDQYAERVNRFFAFFDHDNCERIYREIVNKG